MMKGVPDEGKGEVGMKKIWKKRLAGIVAGLLMMAAVTGCGSKEGPIYPLTVDGTEITLDVTTMQAIYDAGFEVTVMDNSSGSVQWFEVDADTPLDADSVYTMVYIGKGGERYASVSVVTEKACPMQESVIYALTSTEAGLNKITIASVLLTDLSEEKALEIEKNLESTDYYQSCVTDSKILRITRENGATGAVTKLEVEVRYDIDYTG